MDEAESFFEGREAKRKLNVLKDVGLGYLQIGQSLSSLSGGEAQRIKPASELHKKGNIYVMDEPTTGLHMADIHRLVGIIKRLTGNGNTVLVIEHNLDIIMQADRIIDMGPDGGRRGGQVIFEGTPEQLLECKESYTSKYLKEVLSREDALMED